MMIIDPNHIAWTSLSIDWLRSVQGMTVVLQTKGKHPGLVEWLQGEISRWAYEVRLEK